MDRMKNMKPLKSNLRPMTFKPKQKIPLPPPRTGPYVTVERPSVGKKHPEAPARLRAAKRM